jgi:hypothetical protein
MDPDRSARDPEGPFVLEAGSGCVLASCAAWALGRWHAESADGSTTIVLQGTLDTGSGWGHELVAAAGASGVEITDPKDDAWRFVAQAPCLRTGCYAQLCAEKAVFTSCIYKPTYACYAMDGFCARGEGGACGWVETPPLVACLSGSG